MKCWICGCTPTVQNPIAKEHRMKGSDLKSYFGSWSKNNPLYFHTAERKNIPIGGNRSKYLKSVAPMCQNCNSTVTQPYDYAWEQLSRYLMRNVRKVLSSEWIDVSKVFPGSTKKSMLDVHLFFVKLFGCQIIEAKIPIDIAPFSDALLKRTQHDKLYLAIGPSTADEKRKSVLVTPVSAVNDHGGNPVFTHWVYMLGEIAVTVSYSDSPDYMRVVPNAWRPSEISKILRLSNFRRRPQLRRQLLQIR